MTGIVKAPIIGFRHCAPGGIGLIVSYCPLFGVGLDDWHYLGVLRSRSIPGQAQRPAMVDYGA